MNFHHRSCNDDDCNNISGVPRVTSRVAPSTGWMLYYLCFSPSTAIGPPLRQGVRLGSPYLALSRIQTQVGVLNRLVPNRLAGSTARWWCYSVYNPLKTSAKQKRDRGRDSQPRPRPRLNSQPQGATKVASIGPHYHPHRNNYNRKIRDLGFSLCWITKAKAKENVWDFVLIRKCGLLLWLVPAQHDRYESKCEITSGGIYSCPSITKAKAK